VNRVWIFSLALVVGLWGSAPAEKPADALMEAVVSKNINQARQVLRAHPEIKKDHKALDFALIVEVNHYRPSPESHDIQMLELLLDAGANANAKNLLGTPALAAVVADGQVDALACLLSHGATVKGWQGWDMLDHRWGSGLTERAVQAGPRQTQGRHGDLCADGRNGAG